MSRRWKIHASHPGWQMPALQPAKQPTVIWTIGHSSRSLEEFLTLLRSHGIELVADVRRYPGSRAHPHFNSKPFADALAQAGVDYIGLSELGGRRTPSKDSRNTVWRHSAFRGYADYMETPEYRAGIGRLIDAANTKRTAVLCSEALWWRCHRALIADDLKVRGITVLHIMGDKDAVEHPFTSAARVLGGRLVYGSALIGAAPPDSSQ
jgi:uncharacterized protein (DUF488 family)